MDLVGELNRLAGNPKPNDQLGAAGAANLWAGTTGLELVGALNVKAGRPVNGTARELNGVLKLLGFDLDSNAALVGGTDGVTNVANVLRLPGISGNYVSTPDSPSNSITGDIDVRVKLAADSWFNYGVNATPTIIAKEASGSQRSWKFRVTSANTATPALNWVWTVDGSTQIAVTSTANLVGLVANGGILWVRVTHTVNNGAGGNDVKFYTSNDGVTWTQLGTTVTTAGTTSIFDSTSPIEIGARLGGTTENYPGRYYYAEIRNGINGNVVVSWDASTAAVRGDTSPTTMHSVPFNLVTANQYDVETDTTGFGSVNGALSRITSDFNTGAAALQLSTSGAANPLITIGGTTGGTFAVTPGQTYSFTGYTKAPSYTGVGQIKIAWYNAANVFVNQNTASITWNSTWTLHSVTGVAPAGAAWAVPTWTMSGTPPASTLIYVDTMAFYLGTVTYPVAPATWTINGSQWYWDVYSGTKLRTNYLQLPGSAGNYASTPDSPSNSITGDIDLRAKVALDNWGPGAQAQDLISKWNATGNQRSYVLQINVTGNLAMVWSNDGTASNVKVSNSLVNTQVANGATKWVRATLAVATGATNFYVSDDGVNWTSLGAPTAFGATSIFDSTAEVEIGALVSSSRYVAGRFYYAEIRNGIGGTVVGAFDPGIVRITGPNTPASFTGAAGNVWTLNGTAWNWGTA